MAWWKGADVYAELFKKLTALKEALKAVLENP